MSFDWFEIESDLTGIGYTQNRILLVYKYTKIIDLGEENITPVQVY